MSYGREQTRARRMGRAIFMRHGDRPKFPSESGRASDEEHQEADVSITKEGRIRAQESALKLGLTQPRVLASPLRRCVQTAQAAINAAAWSTEIEVAPWLSSEHFGPLDLGAQNESEKQRLIREVLAGNAVPGFEDLRQKVHAALQATVEAAVHQDVLLVTHDWWMSLFLSHITEAFERRGLDIWPEFCEFYSLDLADMLVTYRGHKYEIRLPSVD